MAATFGNPQIIPHLESTVDFTLFDCSWIPSSPRFVVMGSNLDGKGVMQVYSMESRELKVLSQTTTPKAIRCGTFGASTLTDRNLATGSFDGSLAIWDLERLQQPILTLGAHEDLINAIDGVGGLHIGTGAPELATASRDGKVKVWDLRIVDSKNKPVACIQPQSENMKRDAWCLAFGDSYSLTERKLACGFDNGDIKMVDMRTLNVIWETELPHGVCSIQFDRKDIEMNKLLATCLAGNFYVWDLRRAQSEAPFARTDAHLSKTTLWTGRHLPQNRDLFVTTTGSGEIALWRYEYPETKTRTHPDGEEENIPGQVKKLQECQLGDQPIGSFSWCLDKTGLALCTSFDQKIRTIIVTKLNTL